MNKKIIVAGMLVAIALGTKLTNACTIKTTTPNPNDLLGSDHALQIIDLVKEDLQLEPKKFTIIINTTHPLPTQSFTGKTKVNENILAVSIIWLNSDGSFCTEALYCLSTDELVSVANAIVSLTHKWMYQKTLH